MVSAYFLRRASETGILFWAIFLTLFLAALSRPSGLTSSVVEHSIRKSGLGQPLLISVWAETLMPFVQVARLRYGRIARQ